MYDIVVYLDDEITAIIRLERDTNLEGKVKFGADHSFVQEWMSEWNVPFKSSIHYCSCGFLISNITFLEKEYVAMALTLDKDQISVLMKAIGVINTSRFWAGVTRSEYGEDYLITPEAYMQHVVKGLRKQIAGL